MILYDLIFSINKNYHKCQNNSMLLYNLTYSCTILQDDRVAVMLIDRKSEIYKNEADIINTKII